jgi:hypothetical protein
MRHNNLRIDRPGASTHQLIRLEVLSEEPDYERAGLSGWSITLPPDLYENLEEIAQQKKVSLAWVVRDAAERYLADETTKSAQVRAD